MIHLFKKIYVETEQKLDVDSNRIVISKNNGFPFSSNYEEICYGKLYYFSTSFESCIREQIPEKTVDEEGNEIKGYSETQLFTNFFEFLRFVEKCHDEDNKPLFIYVDQDSFNYIVVNWYKTLFSNINFESFISLLKSYIFYNKLFSVSERSLLASSPFDLEVKENQLREIFNNTTFNEQEANNFMQANRSKMSIEFLLASYIYNGSHSSELIKTFSFLLRRNIENNMYNLKQKVYSLLNKSYFLKELELEGKYNFTNFHEIINDKDTKIFFFFDTEIWPDNLRLQSTSSKPIRFENVTEENIIQMKKILNVIELDPVELLYAENFKSEPLPIPDERFEDWNTGASISHRIQIISFLKFLKYKNNLTEDEMRQVIDYDLYGQKYNEKDYTASFSSQEYSSINMYFVDHILDLKRKNSTNQLSNYLLR